jgi:hypothetical protein
MFLGKIKCMANRLVKIENFTDSSGNVVVVAGPVYLSPATIMKNSFGL